MSTDPHELTVRVQAMDGQWETLGADRYRAAVPENVRFDFNGWGPNKCSFVLRRDPGAPHPDLSTWTPVEVEIAGRLVWDGRVQETPIAESTDSQINVQCEGWQYHLDDDTYSQGYVHTRMSEWRDARSYVDQDLTRHVAAGVVEVGDGAIQLTFPLGWTAVASARCVAVLDAGPGRVFKRVVVTGTSSNNTPNNQFYVLGSDTPNTTTGNTLFAGPLANNAGATFTLAGTIAAGSRYVNLMNNTVAAQAAYGADVWFKITSVQCFAETAYESGNASVLKADVVVKDALAHTVFLTDTKAVAAGTFNIPEFFPDGARTAREIISVINGYENYDVRVLLGQRVQFAPRPTAPLYEIGEWSGADFVDATANSGAEIFNRVTVSGTGPDGTPLAVDRVTQGGWTRAPVAALTQPTNPSADVNTTGWTINPAGNVVRDTVTFNTSPASYQGVLGGGNFSQTFGNFVKGGRYRLAFAWLAPPATAFLGVSATTSGVVIYPLGMNLGAQDVIGTGPAGPPGSAIFYGGTAGPAWRICYWDWIQPVDGAPITVLFQIPTGRNVDDIYVERSLPTLVNRRGFSKSTIMPVGFGLTITSGARIADLFLESHKTVPFRGSFNAVGEGGVRMVLGGGTVHPAHIEAGRVVRASHRVDPDTGGLGRDGPIATVAYDHDNLVSQVSIDENRAGLETLLGRLAVVQDQRVS